MSIDISIHEISNPLGNYKRCNLCKINRSTTSLNNDGCSVPIRRATGMNGRPVRFIQHNTKQISDQKLTLLSIFTNVSIFVSYLSSYRGVLIKMIILNANPWRSRVVINTQTILEWEEVCAQLFDTYQKNMNKTLCVLFYFFVCKR